MTLKPYPSTSRIAALAAQAGHVVGREEACVVIETGARKITFNDDKTILDGNGANIDIDEALRQLGIVLAA